MTIQLDHDVFEVSLAEVRAEEAELGATLARLTRRVEAVLDDWCGEAATAYAEAWADWRRGADDVRAALIAIADALATTRADLDETDTTTADRAQRLTWRLR